MHAIEAHGLVKQFDGFRAVDGVDLKVPEGSIYGILGPNGAGKTTLLRVISGLIPATRGTMTMNGTDLRATPPHKIIETGIAQQSRDEVAAGNFPLARFLRDAVEIPRRPQPLTGQCGEAPAIKESRGVQHSKQ